MKRPPPVSSSDDAVSPSSSEIDPGRSASLGILPPGALGVAFFYHMTKMLRRLDHAPSLLGLSGSGSFRAIQEAGYLNIRELQTVHQIPVQPLLISDLNTAQRQGRLPEVLLIATNPDQLFQVVDEMVGLLELMNQDEPIELNSVRFPRFVFCSNGIYFQRLRQVFLEKLEESILLGRLPDLWPEQMPRIVGKIMRGVTIQPGVRDGDGAQAIYQPGHSAITRIAGGEESQRKFCVEQLEKTGASFEVVSQQSATRIEFDKAIVNLTGNLLGIIYSISPAGVFSPLTIGEIFLPSHQEDILQVASEVLQVGKAVKAYPPNESLERIMEDLNRTAKTHRDHIPSSLQSVSLLLSRGKLTGESTPTEEWLLAPLIKYAEAADLHEGARYLKSLRERLIERLKAAAATQRRPSRLPEEG